MGKIIFAIIVFVALMALVAYWMIAAARRNSYSISTARSVWAWTQDISPSYSMTAIISMFISTLTQVPAHRNRSSTPRSATSISMRKRFTTT